VKNICIIILIYQQLIIIDLFVKIINSNFFIEKNDKKITVLKDNKIYMHINWL